MLHIDNKDILTVAQLVKFLETCDQQARVMVRDYASHYGVKETSNPALLTPGAYGNVVFLSIWGPAAQKHNIYPKEA